MQVIFYGRWHILHQGPLRQVAYYTNIFFSKRIDFFILWYNIPYKPKQPINRRMHRSNLRSIHVFVRHNRSKIKSKFPTILCRPSVFICPTWTNRVRLGASTGLLQRNQKKRKRDKMKKKRKNGRTLRRTAQYRSARALQTCACARCPFRVGASLSG